LTGSMVGTPAYMAPEQVAGKSVDYRTDIYSLGLILYEMFTGAPAFRADNAVAVALKQMQENPRPPHEIEPNIPAAMERVVLKCLEKEPTRRFQSIAELEAVVRLPGTSLPQDARLAPVVDRPVFERPIPAKSYVSPLADVAPPRSRSVVGLVFAWLLLLAALGAAGYAGWHWLAPVAWPDAFSFPQASPTPKIPDFALETSSAPDVAAQAPTPAVATAPETATPAADKTAASKPAAGAPSTPADAPDAVAAKSSEAGTPPQPAVQQKNPPPQDAAPAEVQNRANKAFGQTGKAVIDAVISGMIWVGRYDRRERADDAAREIRDLRLNAIVVPRNGPHGQFFVVLTGPFTGKKLTDTTALLQADGFNNARPVQSMEGNSAPTSPSNQ
jgi:hypothetical protein